MICPRCGSLLETRTHKNITPKQLKQQYYFSQWDACPKCGFIQLYEKYKVFNSPEDRFINEKIYEFNKANQSDTKQEGLFGDEDEKVKELKDFLKEFLS
jgi:hypothetical protein